MITVDKDDVRLIRELAKERDYHKRMFDALSYVEIGKKFGISGKQASLIAREIAWSEAEYNEA